MNSGNADGEEERELVTWRGTPGVGDIMWALNSCHLQAKRTGIKIDLEMHWNHDAEHLHHFEDPETIIERMQYIHRFYARKDDVRVGHVLNSDGRYSSWSFHDDTALEADGTRRQLAKGHNKTRFWFESGAYDDCAGGTAPDNDWMFREDAKKDAVENKIVIWRSTFNAETPRTWKRLFTNDDWCVIIEHLKTNGYDVVELTYRTPVREAMYHISTCRQVICYDGMWHYMAKNFCKPMIVISDEGVTKYHTNYALRASHDSTVNGNIWHWIYNIDDMLSKTKRKAVKFENEMKRICR